jgi:hypothetical protein
MAQLSFSLIGGFGPNSLPFFHGTARPSVVTEVSMNGSFVEGRSFMLIAADGRLSTQAGRSRCPISDSHVSRQRSAAMFIRGLRPTRWYSAKMCADQPVATKNRGLNRTPERSGSRD